MGPPDRRVPFKPYGEQSLGDVSRRVETTERDIEELGGRHDRLRERFDESERDTAVFQESIKPWVNAIKGLCYLLGASAVGALIKLILK